MMGGVSAVRPNAHSPAISRSTLPTGCRKDLRCSHRAYQGSCPFRRLAGTVRVLTDLAAPHPKPGV